MGLSSFTICGAQSIVGKWKGLSVKNFYSAEYAEQAGKTMEEKFIENGRRNAHILTLKALADFLKIDLKDFI